MTKGSAEYWIHVWQSNGDGLHMLVLQVAPFKANVVAAGAMDCPLVPVQRNFQTSDKPRLTTFDEAEFTVATGDEQQDVKKTGSVCKQDYELKAGVATMSALEIMQTYAEALPAVGMKITNSKRDADGDVFATIDKDGTTYWAHVWQSNGNGLHILVLQDTPFRASLAPPGADDCPIIPMQHNFQSEKPRYLRDYDVEEFRVADGDSDKEVKKYGKVCQRDYQLKGGLATMSALEIMRNYSEAAAATGYTIANTHRDAADNVYAMMAKDGASYWFRIWQSNGDGLHILAIQEAPFRVVALRARSQGLPAGACARKFPGARRPAGHEIRGDGFQVVEGDQDKSVTKTGKTCRQDYELKTGRGTMSALEIMQNYAEGLPAEGRTITNTNRDEDGDVFATMTKDGVESWLASGRPTATGCMSRCCRSSRSIRG